MLVLSPKILSTFLFSKCLSRFSSSICPPPPEAPVVTLLDGLSSVGTPLALLLKQNLLIKELRIYDEEKDTDQIVCDLNQIDTRTKIRPFSCKCIKDAIKGAHLVISTGGCQCKPGESQKDLFEKNMDNVRNAAIFLAEFNPAAIFCIAKPPIEALVPMAAEEYKKAETYDPRKIIGVTTIASTIANTFIAQHFNKDPAEILCPIIGGLSPKSIIPVISQTKPNVEINSEVHTQLQESIVNAENAVLEKGEMICYSTAFAISRFVNLILKAIKGEENCVECAFVAQTGHIGELLPYIASIVKLGPQGVSSTHMPKMNEFETALLKAAVPHILQNILLGQTFLHGDFSLSPKYKIKKTCDEFLKQKLQECTKRADIPSCN